MTQMEKNTRLFRDASLEQEKSWNDLVSECQDLFGDTLKTASQSFTSRRMYLCHLFTATTMKVGERKKAGIKELQWKLPQECFQTLIVIILIVLHSNVTTAHRRA
jgi:hypothetical protein